MFYDQFVKLCKARGVSPSAVMVSIGLNKSNATFWKKGSIPKGETLQKLAEYFGVSVDYLLGASDSAAGNTETYQPWTLADEIVLRAGGFHALAEFNFLSEEDKAEALKDIQKFVEFTLSKYKQRPQVPPADSAGQDTTPAPDGSEGAQEG